MTITNARFNAGLERVRAGRAALRERRDGRRAAGDEQLTAEQIYAARRAQAQAAAGAASPEPADDARALNEDFAAGVYESRRAAAGG